MNRDSAEEYERLRQLLLNRYYEKSVIEEALETRDYRPNIDDSKEFRKIGTSDQFETNVFADSTHYLDLFFDQVADNIILGEKKYLVDNMLKHAATSEYMEHFTYDDLLDVIETKFEVAEPSIVFMPLTLYSKIHLQWARKLGKSVLQVDEGRYRLILPFHTRNPQLVWSNKYMPFDDIVIASKKYGEWIAKPKVKDRVRVTRSDERTIHAYSVFHFQLRNSQQLLKIEVNPAELDKKRLDILTRKQDD
jgi:hypothetical protein